jgi:hypothetical protein
MNSANSKQIAVFQSYYDIITSNRNARSKSPINDHSHSSLLGNNLLFKQVQDFNFHSNKHCDLYSSNRKSGIDHIELKDTIKNYS